ncbi:MAG TPA: vitamin K epoxide reductase family protein [Vicinamibacterales bacterium]|nr:vitamin K epoxide reductase family protein [Vicinamibacterales bacterium]
MSKRAAVFALLCAVVGLAASAAAAYTHYQLLHDPNYKSFCDVTAKISCTVVYQTQYSTAFGIPVALFGIIWFVLALLLCAVGFTARDAVRESIPGYLFALSTAALAVILYLGYMSIFRIHAYCPVCLTTYAAVIGLFIVSGAATTFPMTTLPRRAARDLRVFVGSPLAIAIAVIVFAGAASTLAFFPREGSVMDGAPSAAPAAALTADQRSEIERFMDAAPRIPLIISAEGAKVLIVKFNDFQCPACGQSYLQYKPILAKYDASNPGAVKMVLKDYPLNPQCNANVTVMLHPAACDAAVAVRLAKLHNKESEMEDWLYTHQPQMTPPSVRQAARDIGGVTDFDAKFDSTMALIKGDIALGKTLDVRGTPTFFINGVKFDVAIQPQYFDQAIAYELKRASAAK